MAESLAVPLAEIDGAAVYAADHEQFNSAHAVVAIRFPGADSAAIVDALGEAIAGPVFLAGQVAVKEQTIGAKEVSVLDSASSDFPRSPTY